MRAIVSASNGVLFGTASVSAILASASTWRCDFINSCAACNGFPTSGRTVSARFVSTWRFEPSAVSTRGGCTN
jgi:hypothetical protein